mgnify:CR=1 FL=1
MSTPAGTKVVVGPDNTLHAVYEDGGRIKYITSANVIIWTAPVIIGDTEAYTPTIAVAADGTIGDNPSPPSVRDRSGAFVRGTRDEQARRRSAR